jgi:uncharacterized membrane protein YsdA (DUF1294 family)
MLRFILSLFPLAAMTVLFFQWWKGVLLYGAVLSFIAFTVYGADKFFARKQWKRVPEKRLLLLAFAGGMPGAAAAMALFRHKTVKDSFKKAFSLLLLLQYLLTAAAAGIKYYL